VAILVALTLALGAVWAATHRRPLLMEGVEKLGTELPDPEERALALAWAAWTRVNEGATERARALAEKAEAEARRASRPALAGPALARLGAVYERAGDTARATALFSESFDASRAAGTEWAVSLDALFEAWADVRTATPGEPFLARAGTALVFPSVDTDRRRRLRAVGLGDLARTTAVDQIRGTPAHKYREMAWFLRGYDAEQDQTVLPPEVRAKLARALGAIDERVEAIAKPYVLAAIRGEEDPWRRAVTLAEERESAGFPMLGIQIRIGGLAFLAERNDPTFADHLEETVESGPTWGPYYTSGKISAELAEFAPLVHQEERALAVIEKLAHPRVTNQYIADFETSSALKGSIQALGSLPVTSTRDAKVRDLARTAFESLAKNVEKAGSTSSSVSELMFAPLAAAVDVIGLSDAELTDHVAKEALAATKRHVASDNSHNFYDTWPPRHALVRCARAAALHGDLVKGRAWFEASFAGFDDQRWGDEHPLLILLRDVLEALPGLDEDLRQEIGAQVASETRRRRYSGVVFDLDRFLGAADRAERSPLTRSR
jgi:hypothetical protein